jgi:hypothetical protein
MDMTKAAVKAALSFEKDSELASLLGIGRWAVGQWPSDKPIPKARQWQLQVLRPDVFGPGPAKQGEEVANAA